jgi:hypothetical protein
VLSDYQKILVRTYNPEAYFARVMELSRRLNMRGHQLSFDRDRFILEARTFGRLLWKLGIRWRRRSLWWRVFLRTLLMNPLALRYVLWLTAFWLHFEEFVPQLLPKLERRIAREIP